MIYWGALLYPAMLLIVLWMWRNVRGMTLDDIVDKSAREHHLANKIFTEHPRGGDWPTYQKWVADYEK